MRMTNFAKYPGIAEDLVIKCVVSEMVLETAINGQATAIVTFNARHFLDAPDRFGLMVLRPGDALRRIRS